jgi:hypothetical protein
MKSGAGAGFDVVVASEVIEHVPDPESFCTSLAGLTVRGKGMAIVSTINRTPRSYATAILGAERVLRLLPVGTHNWNKFITPGACLFCSNGTFSASEEIFQQSRGCLASCWQMVAIGRLPERLGVSRKEQAATHFLSILWVGNTSSNLHGKASSLTIFGFALEQ